MTGTEAQPISKTKAWIRAFRLHTLPLALACIALGNFLGWRTHFHWLIASLTLLTAICLQVLSNLANDYGDAKNGADNHKRTGPARMVQSGAISMEHMKTGIILAMIASLLCGIIVLILSIEHTGYKGAMVLFVLGLLSIGAAIGYTASRKPYGYRGLGDFSVFIFFGLIGVFGSYYLQTGDLNPYILLPSIGMGMLCTGVLNINNIRDIEADEMAGKMTIPIKLGERNAKLYHWVLLLIPIGLFAAYLAHVDAGIGQYIMLTPAILFVINGIGVSKSHSPAQIAPYLKQLVISVLIFTICYGAGFIIWPQ